VLIVPLALAVTTIVDNADRIAGWVTSLATLKLPPPPDAVRNPAPRRREDRRAWAQAVAAGAGGTSRRAWAPTRGGSWAGSSARLATWA
jgi:hypothetical protein